MTNGLPLQIPGQRTADFADFSWLTTMSPAALTVFFVALVAYFCIRLSFINTKFMWVFALIGTVVYSIIGPTPVIVHNAGIIPLWVVQLTAKVVIAISLGVIGVFGAMLSHDKLFRYFAKFWPALAVLSADVDTNGQQPNQKL